MQRKCKRIIGGKTYNTETSNELGGFEIDPENPYGEQGDYLYQTRYGAFFRYTYLDGFDEQDYDTITPLTPEEAQAWLEKHYAWNTGLIESLFGEMPEAGYAEVKYTLRLPENLRDRLAAKAKENNQSLNAWMVRCLEGCAGEAKTKET